MSTALACVFGAAPNAVDAPEKIFDAVVSCAWVSRPMTTSQVMGSLELRISTQRTQRSAEERECFRANFHAARDRHETHDLLCGPLCSSVSSVFHIGLKIPAVPS